MDSELADKVQQFMTRMIPQVAVRLIGPIMQPDLLGDGFEPPAWLQGFEPTNQASIVSYEMGAYSGEKPTRRALDLMDELADHCDKSELPAIQSAAKDWHDLREVLDDLGAQVTGTDVAEDAREQYETLFGQTTPQGGDDE